MAGFESFSSEVLQDARSALDGDVSPGRRARVHGMDELAILFVNVLIISISTSSICDSVRRRPCSFLCTLAPALGRCPPFFSNSDCAKTQSVTFAACRSDFH